MLNFKIKDDKWIYSIESNKVNNTTNVIVSLSISADARTFMSQHLI